MQKKLGLAVKTLYGIGDMSTAAVVGVIGYLLNPFLLNVAGLTPFLVSLLFLIKFAWDAVNDPLMGQLSDRTMSRFGRRKSWMMVATVPLAFFFFLSWIVPDFGMWGKFAYYTAMAVLLDTFYTMHSVPYASLTAEMTDDYNERTSINMFRFGFSLLGSLLATVIFVLMTDGAADPQAAYFWAAAIVSGLVVITGFAPVFKTPERNPQIDRSVARPSLLENMRSVFAVRPFRDVMLLFFLSWTAVQIVQNYIVLYLQYWLKSTGNLVAIVVYLQLSAVAFIVFYGWLSRRIGKKKVYYIGGTTWALVFASIFFLQPGQDSLVIVLALLGGSGTAVSLLIPFSMLPDVIDYDEAENGERREGVFYGYFNFANKLGRGVSFAALSVILGLVGYQAAVDGVAAESQPEAVLLTLRIFVSFLPALIVLASMFIAKRYPITEAVHAELTETFQKGKIVHHR